MFHFWRDSNGNEVDLLIETGGKLMPIEIKSGQTINRDYFKGLERWTALAGDMARNPTLIYAGDDRQTRRGVRVAGWNRSGDGRVEGLGEVNGLDGLRNQETVSAFRFPFSAVK